MRSGFLLTLIWITIYTANIAIPDGSWLLNLISIGVWFFTCVFFIKKSGDFGIMSAQMMLAFTMAGICCAIAESGQWLSEIKTYAFLTGATSRALSLCFFIFLTAFLVFQSLRGSRMVMFGLSRSINLWALNAITLVFIAFSLVLLSVSLIYGHPNDYGVDRYYYWENIAPKWAEYVKFLVSQFTVFIGISYGISRKKRYIFIFILSLVAQFSVGDKVSGMLYATMTFLIPVVILMRVDIGRMLFTGKSIFLSTLLISFFLIASYLSYAAISGSDSGIYRLIDRIVLQGQMWWALDNNSSSSLKGASEVLSNMLGFGGVDEHSTGIFYLMSIISPPSIFQWFSDKNIPMTMGGPVNLAYFFGYPLSILPAIITGVIVGCAFHILYRSILIIDVFLVFFSVKIVDAVFRSTVMGETFYLFSLKMLVGIFAFIFYVIASRATTGMEKKAA
jgi:hypothetical protein